MFKEWKKFVKYNLGSLVLYEIIYKIILLLVMVPFTYQCLNWIIKFSKYSYITRNNIYAIFKKPSSILIIAVYLLILSVYFMVEIYSINNCFHYSAHGYKMGIFRLFSSSVKGFLKVFHPKNFIWLLYSLVMTLLLSYPVLMDVLKSIKLPKVLRAFWKKYILGNDVVKVLLIVLALVMIYFYIRCIFARSISIYENKGFIESLKESFSLTRKRTRHVLGYGLIVNTVLMFCYILLYAIILLGCTLVIYFFVKRSLALTLFIVVHQRLKYYMYLVIMSVSMLCNYSIINLLYFKFKKEDGLEDIFIPTRNVKLPGKRYRLRFYSVCVLAAFISAYYFANVIYSGASTAVSSLSSVQICAHRGSSVRAPENTLEAVELAIEEMADYVEIDVQLTKDKEVVLMHDSSLERTTGEKKNVWEMTLEEIQTLDAGSWHSEEYVETRIPTLEDVLKVCKGEITINIEIKGDKHNKGIEAKVVELIEKYDLEKQCVVTSMSYSCLKNVKEINEKIKTGYITAMIYGNIYDRKFVDFLSLKSAFVTETTVQNAHSKGKEVYVWTVNSELELERMKNLGVDNIITDDPILARKVINKTKYNEGYFELLNRIFAEK